MTLFRSVAFNVSFYVWTTVMTLVTACTLPFPRRASRAVGRAWAFGNDLLLRVCCRIRVEIRGEQHIPNSPCIIASKHQSAWETFEFLKLLPNPVYVLKQELLRIPVFGPCLRKMGHIGVDRGAGASAIKDLVAASRKALDGGYQVVIFPEGTRSTSGQTGRYNPGVAALYRQVETPVCPVALNSGLFWGRNAFRKNAGTIVIEFLEPIAPGLDRREFQTRLEGCIEAATAQLEAGARTDH